jgi:hypothetical protein
MRKLRLLLLASLVAGVANAQYFQHTYGGPTMDFLESGINANAASPQGHIMTGYTDAVGWRDLLLTRTDLDGRFVFAPVFNNRYNIFENLAQVDAKGRRVVHPLAFGGRICVCGDFGYVAGGVSTKFFYALFAPNGGPGLTVSYQLPFPVAEAEATSMVNSTSNPNNMFICGWVRLVAGGQRYPVVMSINGGNGVPNWALMYQVGNIDWYPEDLIESPYIPTTGIPDIALTGHFNQPGMAGSGCFFLLSTANGANTSPVMEYGTPFAIGDDGAFNAIDIANNPFGPSGGPGFVLGGYFHNPGTGNFDNWAMKIDPTGAIVDFSTLIDYNLFGRDDFGNDIIERLNTAGNYEYYEGGYVRNGFFGGDDALVYKLDFAGNPVLFPLSAQFTYGGPGMDRALQLDQYNVWGPNNDGLSTFGTSNGSFPLPGAMDEYFVKSYFNGVTQCNVDLQNPPSMLGPGFVQPWGAAIPNKLFNRQLTINRVPMGDFEICYAPNIATGNNARMAASTDQELMQPGYFPNPVSRDNAVVTINFGTEAVAGEAEIELWNSVGQLCWSKKAAVTDGQQSMEIQLGNELSGGMYHLIVRQNGALNNYRILVQ